MGVVASCFARDKAEYREMDDESTGLVYVSPLMAKWRHMSVDRIRKHFLDFPPASRRGLVVAMSDNNVLNVVPLADLESIAGRLVGEIAKTGEVIKYNDLFRHGGIDVTYIRDDLVREIKARLTDAHVDDIITQSDEVDIRQAVEFMITELTYPPVDGGNVWDHMSGSSSDEGEGV